MSREGERRPAADRAPSHYDQIDGHAEQVTPSVRQRPGWSWAPRDPLEAFDQNGGDGPRPVLIARDDGAALLYAGKVHTVSGESESLKTWLVLIGCLEAINDRRHVLFIDYEDGPEGIAGRLIALGASREAITGWFHYIQPHEPFTTAAQLLVTDAIGSVPAVTVVDGVTEAMVSHGLDPLSNTDVAAFGRREPGSLGWYASAGSIMVMIDHVPKSRENRGRYAIGAVHKLNAVDGAAYTIELVKPFGHGQHGMAKIHVAKDRPGRVREHSPGGVAGMLHLQSEADGSVMAHIEPPKVAATPADAESFRPTVLMERISKYVEAHPGLSGRAIVDAVRGKVAHKRLALELLIAEGYVDFVRVGNAHQHKSGQPFRCGSDGGSSEA